MVSGEFRGDFCPVSQRDFKRVVLRKIAVAM